jgi:uncharacterized protein
LKKVTGKTNKHTKHIPQRTCVGCHTVMAKRTLIRLVRRQDGILIDPTGKAAGRGAYLHNLRSCWEKGLKGSLAHALKTEINSKDLQQLTEYAFSLPEDKESAGE